MQAAPSKIALAVRAGPYLRRWNTRQQPDLNFQKINELCELKLRHDKQPLFHGAHIKILVRTPQLHQRKGVRRLAKLTPRYKMFCTICQQCSAAATNLILQEAQGIRIWKHRRQNCKQFALRIADQPRAALVRLLERNRLVRACSVTRQIFPSWPPSI